MHPNVSSLWEAFIVVSLRIHVHAAIEGVPCLGIRQDLVRPCDEFERALRLFESRGALARVLIWVPNLGERMVAERISASVALGSTCRMA